MLRRVPALEGFKFIRIDEHGNRLVTLVDSLRLLRRQTHDFRKLLFGLCDVPGHDVSNCSVYDGHFTSLSAKGQIYTPRARSALNCAKNAPKLPASSASRSLRIRFR